MSKLNEIIIDDNINEIRRSSESAARGLIEKILPYLNKTLLRFQAIIFAQYISQFSIQAFVKANSPIEKRVFMTIKRTILNLTNDQIALDNHSANIMTKSVSAMIASQTVDNVYSRILMLDQFASFQDLDDEKLIEFYPKMSILLNKSIEDCTNKIENSKFTKAPQQMKLFGKNANNASISDDKSSSRNTTIKK